MDTKERILQVALELYNNQGVNTITSRHIAAEMGISPGNLHYHFKQTDEIIKSLYDRLALDFDAIVKGLGTVDRIDLDTMKEYVDQSFALSYKNRFIFLHFVEIGLRIPAIKKEYAALTKRREKEFLLLFEQLQTTGLLRTDLPKEVLQSLVTQIFIIADFWLSNNELTVRLKGSKAIDHYRRVFLHMLYPYLTSEAQRRFMEEDR